MQSFITNVSDTSGLLSLGMDLLWSIYVPYLKYVSQSRLTSIGKATQKVENVVV